MVRREALGRRVRLDDRGEWLTVVGVVADIRQRGLDQEVQPMLYVPFQQERRAFLLRFVSFVARTATPASVVEGIRAEIRRAAPDLPIESTVTMDEAVAASVAQPRFRMVLLVLFATAATLIATCGIYGLMAYAVTQRRREIGVRMALGAERRDVLRLVLTRAFRIVAAGLIVGLAGAAGVTRVLQRFLFGVTPTDPIVFAIVTLLLLAVGLMAAWLPARRAREGRSAGGIAGRVTDNHPVGSCRFECAVVIRATSPDSAFPGVRHSPRASLSLAHPILAGTPRNAPMPAAAGILRARAAGAAAPALGLRCAPDVRCGGDGCGFRAHAASADSSPERDHSADRFLRRLRTRHRRLAALQPAPTPPALPFGLFAPRRVLRAGPGHSSMF